ncbi:MAG: transporter [Nitrospirota bacterium]
MIRIQRFWKFAGLLLTICFMGIPNSSFAYRPFATEDAGVAGKGVTQLEISWDYLKWKNSDRENILLLVPIYGITDRIELSAEVPYLFHNPEDEKSERGISDINIVSKFLILEEKDIRPAFTLKGVVKTKSGDEEKGLGSGDIDYSLVAVASKTIGDFELHGMIGYTFVGDNGEENIRNIYLYGVAADYGITEKFHVVAEIAGNRHPDRFSDKDPLSGLFGVTYEVSDKIILDGGVRYGFNDAVPKWSTTIGVSLTF